MIIEFFGFPGTGKTTLTQMLKSELEANGYKVKLGTFDHLKVLPRLFLKILYSLLCFIISPVFFTSNFLSIIKSKNKRCVNYFVNLTYLYARYKIYNNKKKIILFDQGLLQGLWSIEIFLGQSQKLNLYRMRKAIDCVIVLELNYQENKNRLISRNKRRIFNSDVSRHKYFNNSKSIIKTYLQTLDEKSLILNAEIDIEENICKIKKFYKL